MLRVLPTTIELHDLDKLVLQFTRNTDICFHVIMNSSDPLSSAFNCKIIEEDRKVEK